MSVALAISRYASDTQTADYKIKKLKIYKQKV